MSEGQTWWWLTTDKFTVGVGARDGKIVACPPIVNKFRGQNIDNLRAWMGGMPGYREEKLDAGQEVPDPERGLGTPTVL